jgi:RsbT co-antagonist protein rsbRD N-terminal domain
MDMAPNEFADLIEFHKEDVVNAWMDAVRADPRIHSDDRLPEYALRDHVPAIIEEICQLLREGETPRASNTREARVHTYMRYRQGYRGRELACELSQLRMAIIDVVTENLADAGVGVKPFVQLSKSIHSYIDEEMRRAFSIYTEAEKEARPQSPPATEPN